MKDLYLSKAMAGVLRHWAVEENVPIDENGWVEMGDLLRAIDGEVYASDVRRVVENGEKVRYEIEDGKVRAVYGHSIDKVSIESAGADIPDVLYHGTQLRNLESILRDGVKPMNRNTVQMSATIGDAISVGDRHGTHTVVLVIDANSMVEDGHDVQRRNSVYTTEFVPPDYINMVNNDV